MELRDIKGVGPKTLENLKDLGIASVCDLLSYFQKLAEIRYCYHVFKDSEYKELFADTNCLIYERRLLNEVVVVCVNRGYNKFDLKFEGQLYDLFNGKLYLNQYCVLPKTCSILSNKHLI